MIGIDSPDDVEVIVVVNGANGDRGWPEFGYKAYSVQRRRQRSETNQVQTRIPAGTSGDGKSQ